MSPLFLGGPGSDANAGELGLFLARHFKVYWDLKASNVGLTTLQVAAAAWPGVPAAQGLFFSGPATSGAFPGVDQSVVHNGILCGRFADGGGIGTIHRSIVGLPIRLNETAQQFSAGFEYPISDFVHRFTCLLTVPSSVTTSDDPDNTGIFWTPAAGGVGTQLITGGNGGYGVMLSSVGGLHWEFVAASFGVYPGNITERTPLVWPAPLTEWVKCEHIWRQAHGNNVNAEYRFRVNGQELVRRQWGPGTVLPSKRVGVDVGHRGMIGVGSGGATPVEIRIGPSEFETFRVDIP